MRIFELAYDYFIKTKCMALEAPCIQLWDVTAAFEWWHVHYMKADRQHTREGSDKSEGGKKRKKNISGFFFSTTYGPKYSRGLRSEGGGVNKIFVGGITLPSPSVHTYGWQWEKLIRYVKIEKWPKYLWKCKVKVFLFESCVFWEHI